MVILNKKTHTYIRNSSYAIIGIWTKKKRYIKQQGGESGGDSICDNILDCRCNPLMLYHLYFFHKPFLQAKLV